MKAKPKIKKVCQFCNKIFFVKPYRRDTARYCSPNCTLKANPPNQSKIKRNYGKDHPHWKGGTISSHGYRKICIKGKQIYEHRYIMEQHLGRKLKSYEHIHHINGNKTDNRIKNLKIVNGEKEHREEAKNSHGYNCKCVVCNKVFNAPHPSFKYCPECTKV